ncbi:MAG: haloacid dehalogenase-like hydrolase [Clostridia bacterium]|nr:haloacid dehalogenase-like hydrolase [Clostridia bacterium]
MEQNTIAIIWDFDKTLINGYMQDPIFKKYNIDGNAFWKEVNALPDAYLAQGIKVNKDTIYLNHMLTCVSQGMFEGLNNKMLQDLGKELVFYPGVPEIFAALKDLVSEEKYQKYGIHVEHYIISTGLTSMIKGSKINEFVEDIWGCEFIENPILSKMVPATSVEESNVIRQTGYLIDNTSKTRAIFEINKGANKYDYIDVNSSMSKDDRRVPFEHMIYIADGPSDVPVFSVLQQYGGKTFAIYPAGDQKAFAQVDSLSKDRRIDMYAEANYSKGTTAYMWLTTKTLEIADSIYQLREEEIKSAVKPSPKHLV